MADYVRDASGRTTEVGLTRRGQLRQVVLTGASYHPFGPVAEWAFGNGRLLQRTLNQNYQPGVVQDLSPGGLSVGYEFDAVGNMVKLRNGHQSDPPLRLYGYDALNRLTAAQDGTTQAFTEGYSYDATGNRTSATVGNATSAYVLATDSHRLLAVGGVSRSYDNAGNTASIGARAFAYSDANRLSQVVDGATAVAYAYSGKGEQVRRSTGTDGPVTVYDEAGHWLGEYDGTGAPRQQVIWLDELPVGLIVGAVAANQPLHYIEADALSTPRTVIDSQRDVAVWTWPLAGEAFGNDKPIADADGDGTPLVFDLRFPGQRYDAASGLNQNGQRDYDAGGARYVESDPIGLAGGWTTYGYANLSPLVWVDPDGLDGIRVDPDAAYQQGVHDGKAVHALAILTDWWIKLANKNVEGADQFYHCMAACEASHAINDPQMVLALMASKESFDYAKGRMGHYKGKKWSEEDMLADNAEDMKVNRFVAACPPGRNCLKRCRGLLDLVPLKKRKFVSEFRPEWGVSK